MSVGYSCDSDQWLGSQDCDGDDHRIADPISFPDTSAAPAGVPENHVTCLSDTTSLGCVNTVHDGSDESSSPLELSNCMAKAAPCTNGTVDNLNLSTARDPLDPNFCISDYASYFSRNILHSVMLELSAKRHYLLGISGSVDTFVDFGQNLNDKPASESQVEYIDHSLVPSAKIDGILDPEKRPFETYLNDEIVDKIPEDHIVSSLYSLESNNDIHLINYVDVEESETASKDGKYGDRLCKKDEIYPKLLDCKDRLCDSTSSSSNGCNNFSVVGAELETSVPSRECNSNIASLPSTNFEPNLAISYSNHTLDTNSHRFSPSPTTVRSASPSSTLPLESPTRSTSNVPNEKVHNYNEFPKVSSKATCINLADESDCNSRSSSVSGRPRFQLRVNTRSKKVSTEDEELYPREVDGSEASDLPSSNRRRALAESASSSQKKKKKRRLRCRRRSSTARPRSSKMLCDLKVVSRARRIHEPTVEVYSQPLDSIYNNNNNIIEPLAVIATQPRRSSHRSHRTASSAISVGLPLLNSTSMVSSNSVPHDLVPQKKVSKKAGTKEKKKRKFLCVKPTAGAPCDCVASRDSIVSNMGRAHRTSILPSPSHEKHPLQSNKVRTITAILFLCFLFQITRV